ncbi:hypothetical protein ACHAXR_001232 [Thalassiosira sp. AJA248-18]
MGEEMGTSCHSNQITDYSTNCLACSKVFSTVGPNHPPSQKHQQMDRRRTPTFSSRTGTPWEEMGANHRHSNQIKGCRTDLYACS